MSWCGSGFGRPLWEMEPADADRYFGTVVRGVSAATRAELEQLFAGRREELASCRKFAPAARNYTVARLTADVGLRINEACMLELDDVRWELGRFGKLNVRHGKGSRRKGPKQRVVPLINGADRVLAWFVEDVWGQFEADHSLPGAPLFPSERRRLDGPGARVSHRCGAAGVGGCGRPASAGLGGPADPARVVALLRQGSRRPIAARSQARSGGPRTGSVVSRSVRSFGRGDLAL